MVFALRREAEVQLQDRKAGQEVRNLVVCMEELLWDAEIHLDELRRLEPRLDASVRAEAALPRSNRRARVEASWARLDVERVASIHARGFAVALAQVREALWCLSNLPALKACGIDVSAALQQLDRQLPQLKDVRDGLLHAADRWLYRHKKGQPIVWTRVFTLPGAVRVEGAWCANTMAPNGSSVQLRADAVALSQAVEAAQAAADQFVWIGGRVARSPDEA